MKELQKLLFLDRDGTIIEEPEDLQVDNLTKLAFLQDAIYYLRLIVDELDYKLVMVTNQDGLGTSALPDEHFWPAQVLMMKTLLTQGVEFDDVLIDKTFAKDNAPTRKPGTALLTKYLEGDYDLENSIMVGDRYTDIQLARNFGGKGILIGRSNDTDDDDKLDLDDLKDTLVLTTDKWSDIYQFLSKPPRRSHVTRKTNETDITVRLNLDGSGNSSVSTGLNFFDHMLEQMAKHSGCDLVVQVEGDLHVDEHHTIEDTALAMGEACKDALGDKRGIERYGFLLPMDDVLAQVAIDFSGRPWLVWEAEFNREMVGDMPTEMFMHFFKSFSDAAGCNLNIKAEGSNEHHKIEAIFKGWAKAIKMAKTRSGRELPSTKGIL
ncbi:MAG: bifunctional histidinol-phosphatase/imidazoleglycerol-phosphate dehydratase HisB [Bacteroidetes bacterium]|nr:bifunctional histidinol-phosphatase/imidazoleglycerol-phosphate dehydratase HisB [Bacteroidota bacterium]